MDLGILKVLLKVKGGKVIIERNFLVAGVRGQPPIIKVNLCPYRDM